MGFDLRYRRGTEDCRNCEHNTCVIAEGVSDKDLSGVSVEAHEWECGGSECEEEECAVVVAVGVAVGEEVCGEVEEHGGGCDYTLPDLKSVDACEDVDGVGVVDAGEEGVEEVEGA